MLPPRLNIVGRWIQTLFLQYFSSLWVDPTHSTRTHLKDLLGIMGLCHSPSSLHLKALKAFHHRWCENLSLATKKQNGLLRGQIEHTPYHG